MLYIKFLICGILCKHYFGCLRLLRSSDVVENPGPSAARMSCRVVYANIRGLYKNSLDLSLVSRDVFFLFRDSCLFYVLHFRVHCSGYWQTDAAFQRWDWLELWGLAVYVRDGFSAYSHHCYECGGCEVIVVRISSTSHNFLSIYLSDKNPYCLLTAKGLLRRDTFALCRATICIGRLARVYQPRFSGNSLDSTKTNRCFWYISATYVYSFRQCATGS